MKLSPNPYVTEAIRDYLVFGSHTTKDFTEKVRYVDEDALKETAILFMDVLRATTTMTVAAAAGCQGIYLAVKPPQGSYDLTPPVLPNCKWLYGGEEHGLPIPGGILNNSPLSIEPDQISEAHIKFYSSNGARALVAISALPAGGINLVSMANIQVSLEELVKKGFRRYWLIGAGFYGSPCLEDTVCGGYAVQSLLQMGVVRKDELEDGARIMNLVASPYLRNDSLLIEDLYSSQVAKLLCKIGRVEDVAACVTGKGIPSDLYRRMTRTVIGLEQVDGIPLLIPTIV